MTELSAAGARRGVRSVPMRSEASRRCRPKAGQGLVVTNSHWLLWQCVVGLSENIKSGCRGSIFVLVLLCLDKPTDLVKRSRRAATEGKSYNAVRCKSCKQQSGLIVCHRQTASAEKWRAAGMHSETRTLTFFRFSKISVTVSIYLWNVRNQTVELKLAANTSWVPSCKSAPISFSSAPLNFCLQHSQLWDNNPPI